MDRDSDSAANRRFYDQQYYGGEKPPVKEVPWLPSYHSRTGRGYYLECLLLMGAERNPGARLLDVACGTGDLLKVAEHLGLNACGMDFSLAALRGSVSSGGGMVLADADDGLPFKGDSFDYVTCLGSLEHFRRQDDVVDEVVRVSKRGAALFFLVPNSRFLLNSFGYKEHQPVYHPLTADDCRALFQRHGLRVGRVLSDNSYLYNLRTSSSWAKLMLKLAMRPFLPLLPLSLSHNFVFILEKSKG